MDNVMKEDKGPVNKVSTQRWWHYPNVNNVSLSTVSACFISHFVAPGRVNSQATHLATDIHKTEQLSWESWCVKALSGL